MSKEKDNKKNPADRARASIAAARNFTPRSKKEKKPCHKGWLQKRGPTHDYGWEKRWCVLTEEELDFYEDESEEPEKRKGEICLSEYTKAVEFRKTDAPGEAAKYVKEKPFGFVIDTEPYAGPKRRGMFYLAGESAEIMNQWIVQIYRASKHIKNLAPAQRTSLAEFIALWDAPVVLVSAPDMGKDHFGKPTLAMSAICKSVLGESTKRARCSIIQGSGMQSAQAAMQAASGWFSGAKDEVDDSKKPAFPLHKYFTIAVDFGSGAFCDSRIRTCNTTAGGKDPELITGRDDLDVDLEAAWKGPGEYNEEARVELAVENSYSFCFWRGMVMGAVSNALVSAGDKTIPYIDDEKTTRVGKMSQASAQGLRLGPKDMPKEEFSKCIIRVVIVASIDGGEKEAVQKKHIPRMCKEVVKELKKGNYPWADDAWTVWCHFPTPEAFVKSLAGSRNLVPDNTSGRQIKEDDEVKPITYMVHRFVRQPSAPSLLGNTEVEDILAQGAEALTKMIEAMLTACDSGNLKQVRSILDLKCNVNAEDDAGLTAISVAAGLGHAEIVQELISRRADVNAKDAEGDSVLTVAVGEGRIDVVKILMRSGADKDIKVAGAWVDKDGTDVTLIDVAQKKGFTEIVDILKPQAVAQKKAAPQTDGPQSLKDELNFQC